MRTVGTAVSLSRPFTASSVRYEESRRVLKCGTHLDTGLATKLDVAYEWHAGWGDAVDVIVLVVFVLGALLCGRLG